MATLLEDIKTSSEWLTSKFESEGLKLDYTIRSLIYIDTLFNIGVKDGKPIKNGAFAKDLGSMIFTIGAYTGQTIIKTVPGSVWVTDDNDPNGEITAAIKLPDETIMWPMQRVMKRFKNGSEDSIYNYGHYITKDYTNEPFDESYWNIDKGDHHPTSKPWWKIW